MELTLRRLRPLGVLLVAGLSLGLGIGQFLYASRAPPPFCSRAASALSLVIGWAYFSCWSLSFYPQLVQNVQRGSVVGLSFDYAALNFVGFCCYSAYNLALFYSPSIRAAYMAANHGHKPEVQANDVFFGLHAAALSAALLAQIWYYPRGGQRFSRACKLALFLFALALPVGMLLAARPSLCGEGGNSTATSSRLFAGRATGASSAPLQTTPCSWLNLLTALSYVKLAITLTKYAPQVWLNFRAKSTEGWNIDNVVLDFAGGVLSLGQLALDSACAADWSKVTGDPAKFGLGFASMVFDTVFMVQHWGLYRLPRGAVSGPPGAAASRGGLGGAARARCAPVNLAGGDGDAPLLLVNASTRHERAPSSSSSSRHTRHGSSHLG